MSGGFLFLAGFMGAGKTTVGREAARILGLPFVDLDEAIEAAAGVTIDELFRRDGEPAFRALEAATLERVVTAPPGVVALGGGTFSQPGNRRVIAGCGVTVWLDAALAVCLVRARTPSRPVRPLMDDPEGVRRLYERRRKSYALANFRVPTEGLSAREVARVVAAWFEAFPGGRRIPR